MHVCRVGAQTISENIMKFVVICMEYNINSICIPLKIHKKAITKARAKQPAKCHLIPPKSVSPDDTSSTWLLQQKYWLYKSLLSQQKSQVTKNHYEILKLINKS